MTITPQSFSMGCWFTALWFTATAKRRPNHDRLSSKRNNAACRVMHDFAQPLILWRVAPTTPIKQMFQITCANAASNDSEKMSFHAVPRAPQHSTRVQVCTKKRTRNANIPRIACT